MNKSRSATVKNNEQGFIALDFIFALTVSFGFGITFFAIATALSMTEFVQYVAYSTSRTYAAANVSPEQQRELALRKYDELTSSQIAKALVDIGWLELNEPQLGDFTAEYPSQAPENNIFVGARIPMRSKILNMRLPLLGNTASDTSTGYAVVKSYLIREVTTQECISQFAAQRYNRLLQTASKNGTQPYLNTPASLARLVTDNGC